MKEPQYLVLQSPVILHFTEFDAFRVSMISESELQARFLFDMNRILVSLNACLTDHGRIKKYTNTSETLMFSLGITAVGLCVFVGRNTLWI